MVAVISVDAYPFYAFSAGPVTLKIQDEVFPDSKETELGSSSQEASPSAGKNTGVVLVTCSCMEVCPHSYFQWVDISEVPGCHLLRQMSSQ